MLIDIDEETLTAAMAALGALTKKAAVNEALRAVVEQHRRRDLLRKEIVNSGFYAAAVAEEDLIWT